MYQISHDISTIYKIIVAEEDRLLSDGFYLCLRPVHAVDRVPRPSWALGSEVRTADGKSVMRKIEVDQEQATAELVHTQTGDHAGSLPEAPIEEAERRYGALKHVGGWETRRRSLDWNVFAPAS